VSDFTDSEFASLDLGDKRRDKRLRTVVARFLDSPARSIKAACAGWAESMAAYRLFNNKAVTLERVLRPHQSATVEGVRAHRSVALIQDTTELDFTPKKHLQGSGLFGASDNPRRGWFLHSQFAVSEDRLPLGVYSTNLYARADLPPGQSRPDNHCLPIEEKESNRWLLGYRQACELGVAVGEGVEIFSVSDREGDIYEIFEHRELLLSSAVEGSPAPAHWIVRAAKDRVLVDEDGEIGENPTRLFDKAAQGSLLGIVEFNITGKTKSRKISRMKTETTTVRSRRLVRQEIRISKVTPRIPRRIGGKKLARVSYWVISAVELDPPEGEKPISWVLLTSFEVGDLEAARRILRLYLARWDIEVFHRVLKTGCRVEEIQLKTEEALRPCLALYLIVAWRILYLTHLGRECPDLPCSVVFEEAEWKSVVAIAVKRKMKVAMELGGKEPDLSRMIHLVAVFGGYLGRNKDGPPGPQSMWQGLTRVRDFAIAWEAFGK